MTSNPPPDLFPWMPPLEQDDGPPPWDQEEADWLVGKYALVGMTWLEPDGKTVKAQGQYHGRIVAADKDKGFKIECEGVWAGKTMGLPPHLQSFRPANPGKYELRSTGEVVNDPDVLSTWTVTAPYKS
jgi:hypothetical protein